jgi:hypothetical protein
MSVRRTIKSTRSDRKANYRTIRTRGVPRPRLLQRCAFVQVLAANGRDYLLGGKVNDEITRRTFPP